MSPPRYIRVVYPTSWALIQDDDGTVREATPEELVALALMFRPALERSMIDLLDQPGTTANGTTEGALGRDAREAAAGTRPGPMGALYPR